MTQPHTVILVGAGHVHLYHLYVAAHAKELIERGARVVLIDPGEFWYSGLATGLLGGMYEPAEDQVNPRALIEAHGGQFIQDRVESVDSATRRLHLAGGRDLANDHLSLNVGSRVNVDLLPGAANDATVWPVKPIRKLPQKRYLAILNLGDGSALSTWGPWWWNGRSSMWLKDFIDRRFLDGYRQHSEQPKGGAGETQ